PAAVVGIVLADLESRLVEAGAAIVRQGDPPGPMFLLEEGRARIFREDNGTRAYQASMSAGEDFGEVAALSGSPRSATVEATPTCRLLALAPETVRRLADALPEFRARLDERILHYGYKQLAQVPSGVEEEIVPAAAAAQVQVSDALVDQVEPEETAA